jgi:hypothetical protein
MTGIDDIAPARWSGLAQAARLASVARLEPVSRSQGAASIDPARRGRSGDEVPILPRTGQLAPADVMRFERALLEPGAVAQPGWTPLPAGGFDQAETAADRIVATLHHLRGLRGL